MRRSSIQRFVAGKCGTRTLLLLAGLVAAGCARGGGAGFSMPPMPVETGTVGRAPVADRFEALGSVEAGDVIYVTSEIDGTVVSIPFREGAVIGKGGLIALLDDAQLRAEEKRTAALKDQAAVTWSRVKSIV